MQVGDIVKLHTNHVRSLKRNWRNHSNYNKIRAYYRGPLKIVKVLEMGGGVIYFEFEYPNFTPWLGVGIWQYNSLYFTPFAETQRKKCNCSWEHCPKR